MKISNNNNDKGCIRWCEEFKYLIVKIDKEDRQENGIKNRINQVEQ